MENRYKHSLSPVKIGNVEIKNRYVQETRVERFG